VTTAMAAFPPCRHMLAPASGCSAPNFSALPDACAARTRPCFVKSRPMCRPVGRPTGKHAKSDLMAGLPSRVYASLAGHARFAYLDPELDLLGLSTAEGAPMSGIHRFPNRCTITAMIQRLQACEHLADTFGWHSSF
jgi:hypothetical protein